MIAKLWSKTVGSLQSWIFFLRDALFFRLSLQQASDDFQEDESRDALPLSIEKNIRATIQELELPADEFDYIAHKSEQHLSEWRLNPNLSNHTLVLLHTPTTIAKLPKILYDHAIANKFPLQPLNWTNRPADPSAIAEKLRQQIGGYLPQQSPEVVVIPDIGLCFLRHVEGLDGIDFICQTLLEDSVRFWVIVANTISWDYLAQVTRLNACCSVPLQPYELSGDQLQEWLQPIVTQYNIVFSASSINFPQSKSDKNPEHQYFESLARLSQGDKAVAVEIFMGSLYLEAKDETQQNRSQLMAQHPSLPPLPPLDAEDLYILYSLLLHGGLQFFALAKSLGHEPINIQPRLQKLQRSGIIRSKDSMYQIDVLHYPRLKQMLINSNFAIE